MHQVKAHIVARQREKERLDTLSKDVRFGGYIGRLFGFQTAEVPSAPAPPVVPRLSAPAVEAPVSSSGSSRRRGTRLRNEVPIVMRQVRVWREDDERWDRIVARLLPAWLVKRPDLDPEWQNITQDWLEKTFNAWDKQKRA